jgi:hypothetical protein
VGFRSQSIAQPLSFAPQFWAQQASLVRELHSECGIWNAPQPHSHNLLHRAIFPGADQPKAVGRTTGGRTTGAVRQ